MNSEAVSAEPDRLTFDAAIASVGGAIRLNSGRQGGRVIFEVPETDAAAVLWLIAVCRERRLRLTVEVADDE